jgi:hypothetical protein
VENTNLGAEDIHRKPIEAADDRLFNVEAEAVKGSHGGQQDARPSSAEHVDVHRLTFPHPHLNLNTATNISEFHSVPHRYTHTHTTDIKLHDMD